MTLTANFKQSLGKKVINTVSSKDTNYYESYSAFLSISDDS